MPMANFGAKPAVNVSRSRLVLLLSPCNTERPARHRFTKACPYSIKHIGSRCAACSIGFDVAAQHGSHAIPTRHGHPKVARSLCGCRRRISFAQSNALDAYQNPCALTSLQGRQRRASSSGPRCQTQQDEAKECSTTGTAMSSRRRMGSRPRHQTLACPPRLHSHYHRYGVPVLVQETGQRHSRTTRATRAGQACVCDTPKRA